MGDGLVEISDVLKAERKAEEMAESRAALRAVWLVEMRVVLMAASMVDSTAGAKVVNPALHIIQALRIIQLQFFFDGFHTLGDRTDEACPMISGQLIEPHEHNIRLAHYSRYCNTNIALNFK